jgi:tryptophan 2,3-dioxygenase
MELSEDTLEKLQKLAEKYSSTGQDLNSYLEGLLHTEYLTYWDYIHLDTLMTLQTPKTAFPDEQIFIIYHQITELYFRLILSEMEQICLPGKEAGLDEFKMRLRRVSAYFKNLSGSFDVMVNGMDPKQFLKFRMALLPASGFQSAQYRMIELISTGLPLLVHAETRNKFSDSEELEKLYANLYWKFGNIELKSGRKTLTLTMFEEKYDEGLLAMARKYRMDNFREKWLRLSTAEQQDPELVELMKQLDLQANIFWPLSHYKSAVRYLHKDMEDIKATGGTNWQKYLPPRFQRVIFFPEIWTDAEKEEWGKGWVMELFNQQVESYWK